MEDKNEQARDKSKKALKNIGVIGHVDMGSTLLSSTQVKERSKRIITIGKGGATTSEQVAKALAEQGDGVIVIGSDINDDAKERLKEAMKHIDFTTVPNMPPHSPFGDYMNDRVFKLTNEYRKFEEDKWEVDYSEFPKVGEMGGKTKSSKQGFINKISKRRNKKKNKKTHRK